MKARKNKAELQAKIEDVNGSSTSFEAELQKSGDEHHAADAEYRASCEADKSAGWRRN